MVVYVGENETSRQYAYLYKVHRDVEDLTVTSPVRQI